jgi:hypothetical protein
MLPTQHQLLHDLSHELWQTEVSASQHCRREAERLGDTPPARALLAAAEHADSALAELSKLPFEQPIAPSTFGASVGKLFSEMRDTFADKMLTSERSYRFTLLGLRHGIDLVRLMQESVQPSQDNTLPAFFESWLNRRSALVEEVAIQLRWFADRPEQARERARPLLPAKLFRLRVLGARR